MVRDDYEMKPKGVSRGGSLFQADPQTQLLNALRQRNITIFRRVLKSEAVDLDHCYDYPDYKTCLDIACSEAGFAEFVEVILDNHVDVNKINDTHRKAPIHFAVEIGDVRIVKSLLDHKDINVNVLSKGNTALHSAIKEIENIEDDREVKIKKYEYIIESLVKAGTDVNIPDQKNITPIYSAAKQGLENVIKILIDYSENPIDIDSYKDKRKKTARQLLQDSFPHLLDRISSNESQRESINVHKLFSHLSSHDEDKFLRDFEKIKKAGNLANILSENNGMYTLLQFACNNGMDKAVDVLLKNEADPNLTSPGNSMKPIALACSNGYFKVLKHLLNNGSTSLNPVNGESLLQTVIKDDKNSGTDENVDYKECMKLLLENSKESPNINYTDIKDNTALHYAARGGDQETVLSILRKGACIGIRNKFNEPPLADISAKTLETYLDECLTTNSERPNDEDYEIQFNYSFLVPPSNINDNESTKIPLMDDSDVKGNESDPFLAPETDALLYMTRHSDLKPLLKHPIITSFLYLKWQRISCLFYVNITFYALFWLSLILHILFGFSLSEEKTDFVIIVAQITKILTTIGLILLIFRETVQLTVAPKTYLKSIENWLEICLIIVTSILMFSESTPENPRQQLYPIAILLSSAELVLLIGQFPMLSTNIVMLKTVSWNFFKFLLWYCILIIAFALSFYTLFRTVQPKENIEDETKPFDPNKKENDEDKETDFFLDPGMSLFKTIVMLTGEFDAASINFESFPITSHIIFIIFVFMIPIVLFNLLNGLAVSDTQAIKANAELVGHISRIEMITYFENIALGDMSPYKNAISKVQNACCWLPGKMCINSRFYLSRPFARKICLFPNFLPMARIGVKTNQESKITIFTNDRMKKKQDEDDENNTTLCCFNTCNRLRMDRKIVKAAKAVISKRYEEKSELTKLQEKVDNLEKILHQIYDSVKQN